MGYTLAILSLVALQGLAATALPTCVCTRNRQPVCGSDGHTYSNQCLLNCKKHNTGKNITVARQGSCEETNQTLCLCTYQYKPVCGSDGNTYPNKCVIKCKKSTRHIQVVSQGECPEKVTEPPCICTEEIDYVCGSDGNSYTNSCKLNCATAQNPSLSIQSQGKCDDQVKVEDLSPLPQVMS